MIKYFKIYFKNFALFGLVMTIANVLLKTFFFDLNGLLYNIISDAIVWGLLFPIGMTVWHVRIVKKFERGEIGNDKNSPFQSREIVSKLSLEQIKDKIQLADLLPKIEFNLNDNVLRIISVKFHILKGEFITIEKIEDRLKILCIPKMPGNTDSGVNKRTMDRLVEILT